MTRKEQPCACMAKKKTASVEVPERAVKAVSTHKGRAGMVDDKLALLIAAGAAVASNCVSCLEKIIPELRDAGVNDNDIRGAIEFAQVVKNKPATIMKEAADALTGTNMMEKAAHEPCPLDGMKSGMRFRMTLLIAAGAAMGANCEPCLNKLVPDMIEAGLIDSDIRRAVTIGQAVKERSAAITKEAADHLTNSAIAESIPANGKTMDRTHRTATCCG